MDLWEGLVRSVCECLTRLLVLDGGISCSSLFQRFECLDTTVPVARSTCGIFFFLVAMCGFTATGFLPALVLERALFYRERADGLYNSVTYYVAKLIEEARPRV